MFITMLAAALLGAQSRADVTPSTITGYTYEEGIGGSWINHSYYGAYSESGNVSGGGVQIKADPSGTDHIHHELIGGYADRGDAFSNAVTMNGGEVGALCGGGTGIVKYGTPYGGNSYSNSVTVNGGLIMETITGGNARENGNGSGGSANNNSVTLTNVQPSYNPYGVVPIEVFGGYGEYDAYSNSVTVTGSGDMRIWGGYAYDSDASGNTVSVTESQVTSVIGGKSTEGDASGNTVTIANSTVSEARLVDGIYGGYAEQGDANNNTVTVTGGQADTVEGGYGTNANGNTVTVSGVTIEYQVEGGRAFNDEGTANDNTVTMNGGRVGLIIAAIGDSTVGNTVVMNGGQTESICAGESYGGENSGNTVIVTEGELQYGISAGELFNGGELRNNRVYLVGKGATATIGGKQYTGGNAGIQAGGTIDAAYVFEDPEEGAPAFSASGNSIDVYGTGIKAGAVAYYGLTQALTFHLRDGLANAGEPMVTITSYGLNLTDVELGIRGDDVTDWSKFEGRSITLVQAAYNVTGVEAGTDVNITDEGGETLATATLTLVNGKALVLTFPGDGPVPPPVPGEGPDALDVALVNSLWASSAYVREFVRLSEAQGYALKDGDTAVWGGGFGTFMHATGDRGFKSNGGGYGIGVNHAFSADTYAGISLGQGFGSYHNSGADGATVHQRAILAAATLSNRVTKEFSLGAHVAFGSVRNRADCRLDGASERARWNDTVFNLGARAAYDFHVTEATAITPFLGMDWMNGAQDTIGGVYGRHYAHGRLNELRMPVGVTVSTSVEAGSTKLLPQLSVAYVPALAQQLPHADVSGNGQSYRAKGYAPGRNAFMLNAGMNVLFSDSWSAGAFYTLETRRHSVNQSVNASVRYTF